MKKISIVVPIYNELANLEELLERLQDSLESVDIPYEIIFVDDHSSDGTYEYLQRFAKSERIIVLRKQGRRGKAFSLTQGFEKADGTILAMIDADLQYPPEAIPGMIQRLLTSDVVVANRKEYRGLRIRRLMSKTFRFFFGKLLFGLRHDIQSGLKLFRRDVWETVVFQPRSSWSFDLEFLYKASEAGFQIDDFNIEFYERRVGASSVSFVKSSFQLATNALSLRVKRIHPCPIPATNKDSMVGAGLGWQKQRYITHTTLSSSQSAIQTFSLKQKVALGCILAGIGIGGLIYPLTTIQAIIAVLSFIYFVDVLFHLYLILKSLSSSPEIVIVSEELRGVDDRTLPVYSILCPLYREAHIIPQFIQAVSSLDYPKDKLEVLLLLEEDDAETLRAVSGMRLPPFVRIIVVPHSVPKTKPKACNYGLGKASGEYIVVYDAEDIPDPLQLKKAYLGFRKVGKKVVCLQAKLNYYNPEQNILTRLFTAEYSLWFDLVLCGLQSIGTAIPLGGTSNHFRTQDLRNMHGWDPFNVAEDADLGVRLFKRGYKTAIIDSTTFEEANSNLLNWLRQRSRWLKGYMQTYLVHTRDSFSFVRTRGYHAFVFQLIIGGKLAFILINPVLWLATFSYFVFYSLVGPAIESVYPPLVFYMAAVSLVFGNFMFMYSYMIGCAKRAQWSLMKYIFFVPIYWLMISLGEAVALYQLLIKPHYWEKTIHGFHLQKQLNTVALDADIEMQEQEVELEFAESFKRRLVLLTDFFGLFGKEELKKEDDKRLRILIFNWRDTKHKWAGGAELYLHELAKRWARDGNSVTIFCGNDNYAARNELVDGVEVVRRGGAYMVYAWAFLYYILKFRGKFDVIIDSENGIPFFTPLFVKEQVFLLVHHIHQEVFRSHLIFPLSNIAMFLEAKVMPAVYRDNTVITVSESSKKEILTIGLGKRGVEVVHPGVESHLFSKDEKTAFPSFIYLGRLKPYKNIDVIIFAFEQILRPYPDARLLIVGEGESIYALKKLVENLQIEKSVDFYGKVSDSLKASLLAKSWVALQPSQIEGWGITVIETNAAGTPVIASDVPGLCDSVVDRKTGVLVRVRDVDEWARAMADFLLDKKYRDALSKGAYLWAQNFSWDKSAQHFYRILTRQAGYEYESIGKIVLARNR